MGGNVCGWMREAVRSDGGGGLLRYSPVLVVGSIGTGGIFSLIQAVVVRLSLLQTTVNSIQVESALGTERGVIVVDA